ncbi:hypothetical protein N9E91_04545 [Alphaproteobacteria bacterium]|nr:hypothetical protein [Alphaproteobacteria bacterium]
MGEDMEHLVEPSQEKKEALHAIYKEVFNRKEQLNSDYQKKAQSLMTYLFAWENWSWRVEGISKKAFEQIIDQESGNFSKGLVRHHFLEGGRDKTYSDLLGGNKPLSLEEFFHCFWERDRTVILTRAEHNTEQNIEDIQVMKLNWKTGYFQNSDLIGFKVRKGIERQYLLGLPKEDIEWETICSLAE